MNKIFKFQGIDAKTEWKLGLTAGVPAIVVFLGGVFLFITVLKIHFIISVIIISFITVCVLIGALKQLSNLKKNKKWVITFEKEDLKITFQDKVWKFQLSDIRMIKNMGNVGFRYLTIITKTEKIKIRVGNTGLIPFSTEEDIKIVDEFIAYLKPFIEVNFNKMILKNRLDNYAFPNCGVYVVKTEKIRYGVINKMKPIQVIIIFTTIGFTLVVLLIMILDRLMNK